LRAPRGHLIFDAGPDALAAAAGASSGQSWPGPRLLGIRRPSNRRNPGRRILAPTGNPTQICCRGPRGVSARPARARSPATNRPTFRRRGGAGRARPIHRSWKPLAFKRLTTSRLRAYYAVDGPTEGVADRRNRGRAGPPTWARLSPRTLVGGNSGSGIPVSRRGQKTRSRSACSTFVWPNLPPPARMIEAFGPGAPGLGSPRGRPLFEAGRLHPAPGAPGCGRGQSRFRGRFREATPGAGGIGGAVPHSAPDQPPERRGQVGRSFGGGRWRSRPFRRGRPECTGGPHLAGPAAPWPLRHDGHAHDGPRTPLLPFRRRRAGSAGCGRSGTQPRARFRAPKLSVWSTQPFNRRNWPDTIYIKKLINKGLTRRRR